MINLYQPRQPGDILRLHVPIGDIEPDTYVLLSLGDTCCLALLGENKAGQLCVTSSLVDVSLADLSRFIETGLHVQPLLWWLKICRNSIAGYPLLHTDTLSHLWSQGQYYAWKDNE